MKPQHILVISQYFYPEPFRINDMCVEWVKRGYKVTVVTGIPNYPQGTFYPGYNWFKNRKETWNGVDIIRIPLTARGKSSLGIAFNYASFVLSGFFWSLLTDLKADIVFTFEVSPMTQGLLGVWYSKRRKIQNYIYVQDLWPENVEVVTGVTHSVIIKPIRKMADYIYKNNDRIFVTSPSFVTEVQKRIPEESEKIIYWPQYAESFYCPMERQEVSEIPDDGCFKLAFTGNIGQAQGLDILVRAAQYLAKQGVQDVSFVIIGDGRNKEQLRKDIEEEHLEDMFLMIDRQPAERIPEMLSVCDAAFVSFMNDPLFANTIPAKLQSYMACGMPIIASAEGETERIVKEADCGVCCPLGDAEALAQSILQMKNEMCLTQYAENARTYFLRHFEKQMLMDEMETYLSNKIPDVVG